VPKIEALPGADFSPQALFGRMIEDTKPGDRVVVLILRGDRVELANTAMDNSELALVSMAFTDWVQRQINSED
jgi:hypothetical protein